ncbi:MAG: hypothetical protein Q4P29_01460 [Tissierellia bacterium]|nr:hypothetical protein [Tissierellia bacterium]
MDNKASKRILGVLILAFLITLGAIFYLADRNEQYSHSFMEIHGSYKIESGEKPSPKSPSEDKYNLISFSNKDSKYRIVKDNITVEEGSFQKSNSRINLYYLTSDKDGALRNIILEPATKSFVYIVDREADEVLVYKKFDNNAIYFDDAGKMISE